MKILGMGNALVDVLAVLNNDELLDELCLPKGSMQLIDADKRTLIFEKIASFSPKIATGGSASNTALALAKMGIPCGFIGKIGSDYYGDFYVREMQNAGVVPHFILQDAPSGTAMTLISPDGERTFGTYLGIAAELSDKELDPDIFRMYDYFYIEGYLVQNYDLIEEAMRLAKKLNAIVAIDLASFNVVEANREFLQRLIREYVDIVFANEEEAKALTGKPSEDALHEIGSQAEIAVVKIGSKGSWIMRGDEKIHVPAFPAKMIDATAAGDFYAAGFFYGLAHGANLEQCGKIGSLLASNVIEVVGTKLTEETWEKICNIAEEIKA